MTDHEQAIAGRRATIVGCGLIGGSIALALHAAGWVVSGVDTDSARSTRAFEVGAIDSIGQDPQAEITFICVPVMAVPGAAAGALAATAPYGGLVTDVGSVKGRVVAAIDDARFIGGHPMAGSEQEGVDGADVAMFHGATWVLTPTAHTDPDAFSTLRGVVVSLGAEAVAIAPERHDELVALVSHVPHLTAAALMGLADDASTEHATLLRMAAGGFRDMTRIAAGHPGIWPDICTENADAIVAVLDDLLAELARLRGVVATGGRTELLTTLERARHARANLPARMVAHPEALAEVRIPVPDRTGVLAEVTTLAGELGVNIVDLEIAHSAEGDRGVIVLLVDAAQADLVRGGLFARGYRPAVTRLS